MKKKDEWKIEFKLPKDWNHSSDNEAKVADTEPTEEDGKLYEPLNYSARVPATLSAIGIRTSTYFKTKYPMLNISGISIYIEEPVKQSDTNYTQYVEINIDNKKYDIPKDTPKQFLYGFTREIKNLITILDKFRNRDDETLENELDICKCMIFFTVLCIRFWKEYSQLFADNDFVPSSDMITAFIVSYSV